jgi:hypothetical protein
MTKTHTEMADIKRMVAAAVALLLMGSLQAQEVRTGTFWDNWHGCGCGQQWLL